MSERLDGKKQLEEMLNRPTRDFDKSTDMSFEQDKILYTARHARLIEALHNLSHWCAKRAEGEHDDDTTITMLLKKVNELPHQINKAGWMALDEFNKQNNETH
jgi:hypothetical protein